MNFPSPSPATPHLNRRQFGLIVGGGALLLVGGGTYGVVSRRAGTGAELATTFGTLSLVQAGRLDRLDATGQPAATPLATAITRVTKGPPIVAVAADKLDVQRVSRRRDASAAADHHNGDPLLDSDWPQPGNFTWGDVVVLEIAVLNDKPEPVLFSPGQLRLKLPSGITVAPQDSDHGPGTIAARTTEQVWISYLAPHDSVAMQIEYSGPGADAPQALTLPMLTVTRGQS